MVRLAQSMASTTPLIECWRGGNAQPLFVAASSKPAATVRGMKFGFMDSFHPLLAQFHQFGSPALGRAIFWPGVTARQRGELFPCARTGRHGGVLCHVGERILEN